MILSDVLSSDYVSPSFKRVDISDLKPRKRA